MQLGKERTFINHYMQQKKTRQALRASELIVKFLRGHITPKEQWELEKWVAETEGSSKLMQEITDAEMLQQGVAAFGQVNTDEKWEQLLDKVIAKETTNSKKLNRTTWFSAAAVLLITVACWMVVSNTQKQGQAIASTLADSTTKKYGDDALPGSFKAELVSGNGMVTHLIKDKDSTFNKGDGTIYTSANMLVYENKEGYSAKTEWNTLRTPNGGEYAVTLADGTKVWLNAASSLHYPMQFTGNERRVELTGEAYFEIAKNKNKPFIVAANKMDVQAVGTVFNVNSYVNADSATITTLEEGSIKVTTKHSSVMVKPGQQIKTDLITTAISNADVSLATAWKNGLFQFNNAPLAEVVQQLSRWYDVQVMYEGDFKQTKFFTGEIKRNVPLSKLLQMLELTGIATFKIEKNTVTILPFKR